MMRVVCVWVQMFAYKLLSGIYYYAMGQFITQNQLIEAAIRSRKHVKWDPIKLLIAQSDCLFGLLYG